MRYFTKRMKLGSSETKSNGRRGGEEPLKLETRKLLCTQSENYFLGNEGMFFRKRPIKSENF